MYSGIILLNMQINLFSNQIEHKTHYVKKNNSKKNTK